MRDNDLMQVQDPDSESLKVLIAVFAFEMNATCDAEGRHQNIKNEN